MANVAVIGLGMGRVHLRVYSALPDVRILAIADVDRDRLLAYAKEYGVPHAFEDYRDLLALPELDAVSICLPNYLHKPATIDALRAGKHVLVEKPMAMSAAEAEEMLAVAQEHNKTLAVSMNYRWSNGPESWYLKHLISEGKLGTIYYIRS
ncbi:MAG: Gfo/Idh/MocA family oxidoreductase, partial [Firmicutes bacterium]|nr:Gfo/Idh/MocA family oxidoreductase [Bacillota bacterium]